MMKWFEDQSFWDEFKKREVSMIFEKYVIDAAMCRDDMYCYVPYENDKLITGFSAFGFCPGELVGVVHVDGQEAVERWCKENPDWKKIAESQIKKS